MLENEFYELDSLTSIVVSYEKILPIDPFDNVTYQATVRYVTTRKCLTVKSVETLSETKMYELANVIVAEMQTEYLEDKGSKL